MLPILYPDGTRDRQSKKSMLHQELEKPDRPLLVMPLKKHRRRLKKPEILCKS